MSIRRILLAAAAAASLSLPAAASGLAGAPAPFDKGGVKVALVRYLSAGDFYQAYQAGAEAQARALGIDLRVFPGRQDAAEERDQIEQAINLGGKAIVIDHGLPEALKDVAQKALDAGITVVAFDVDLDNPKIPQVEQSDHALARRALDQVVADNGTRFDAAYVYVAGFAPLDRRNEVWADFKARNPGVTERARFGSVSSTTAATVDDQAKAAPAGKDLPSLKGKTIAISVAGTDHFFDLKAYQAQVETVKELGGTPIGLDAGRNDKALVSQLQTLVTQRPDAVIQTLGTVTVIDPWLKKLRQAGIPVFSVDVPSTNVINAATSDNFSLGAQLALQLVSDIGGTGNLVVFNGFSGVPVCEIRYNQLRSVLKYYPNVKILEPELRDVIPNTVQDAYGQITALLSKYPEKGSIAAIWSAWDIPQLGATQALIAAGRTEVRTYGVDGTPEVLALVKDPKAPAAAVAAQQPSVIGRTAVINAARYLNGDTTLPSQTFIPAVIANKANAAEVQKQLGQA